MSQTTKGADSGSTAVPPRKGFSSTSPARFQKRESEPYTEDEYQIWEAVRDRGRSNSSTRPSGSLSGWGSSTRASPSDPRSTLLQQSRESVDALDIFDSLPSLSEVHLSTRISLPTSHLVVVSFLRLIFQTSFYLASLVVSSFSSIFLHSLCPTQQVDSHLRNPSRGRPLSAPRIGGRQQREEYLPFVNASQQYSPGHPPPIALHHSRPERRTSRARRKETRLALLDFLFNFFVSSYFHRFCSGHFPPTSPLGSFCCLSISLSCRLLCALFLSN